MIRAGIGAAEGNNTIAQRMTSNPLVWGAVLTITGLTFLLHMLFDITLPIRELLPFALVGFGGYMIYEYARNRSTASETSHFDEHWPPPSVVSGSLPSARESDSGTGEILTQSSVKPAERMERWSFKQ